MRQLSETELQEIRRHLRDKEISSAEILMEIYDHYISHLQGYSSEEFQEQLMELELKFSYPYCRGLQAKFNSQVRKEINKTQWQVLKQYFCWSRLLYVLLFSLLAFQMSRFVTDKKEIGIFMLFPLLVLAISHVYFLIKSHFRIKTIKKTFKTKAPLQSSMHYPFSEKLYLPVMMAYTLMWTSEYILNAELTSNLAPSIASVIFIILSIYAVTLFEVWHLKTKSTMI